MAIVQHDPDRPNAAVRIDPAQPAHLVVDPITINGVTTQPLVLDATPFQGGPLRLYLDADGSISTDLVEDHFWLLAEAVLPERQFDIVSAEVDEAGQQITQMVERPLDLHEVEVVVFPLPEERM